ncbi:MULTISPECIES: cytosine permease [unclassified Polaribacter]|uniref:cytosine permease n=1 Tax=unclassified Polaribacter TaxID=196858 RepID=UPI0011BED0D0|nr:MULTISPECIES: cytosine permease [unclassified Polaribacter]TXD50911.1 permease [Polaribacter sp. IC063]TXD62296.1 permease [Polaribacter sp. IC066]
MENISKNSQKNKDSAFAAVPLSERQPWYVPAIIFGGLEFCIPVLLIGGILIANFSLLEIIGILIIGLVFFQWIGNAIQGYIGAKTGLTSSALAALSFGKEQARIFVGLVILMLTLGWWAIQTSVAADAFIALLGINKQEDLFLCILSTALIGFLFAIPSILGYGSIKWVDYIAIPAGLLLVTVALYLSINNLGWEKIATWNPKGGMSFTEAINLVIGINVAQWLIAPDYTRFAKPKWKDNILIPLGIIIVGFPLFLVGGIMSMGSGNADIVQVMQELGFPAWGFVVLWVATWTSQLVSNYTGGLVLCNMFNLKDDKSRKIMTLLFAVLGIILALIGIMDQFINFLYALALVIPVIAGVIMSHYFFVNKTDVTTEQSWNWLATISVLVGLLVGYLTQYQYPFGIPAVQSLIISGTVYVLLNNWLKSEKK